MDKSKISIGIMAASTLQMAVQQSLVGAIPLGIDHYHTSPHVMQTIFALPTLSSVPMSLVIGSLVGKTGKKIPLLIGITLMLVAGIAPAVFDLSLVGFITVMIVLGLGIGCLMTLAASLIADYFSGAEQSKMMARQSAFINMGGMVLALTGGVLLVGGWRAVFWVFLYALPVLIITAICIPNKKSVKENHVKQPIKLTRDTYIFCGMIFCFGFIFAIRNANAGLLAVERELGTVSIANYATSIMTATGVVMGFLYGYAVKAMKQYLLPVSFAMCVIGMVLIGSAGSVWAFYFGHILTGISLSVSMPTLMSRTAQSVNADSSTFAISLLLSANCVALFVSPSIVKIIMGVLSVETAQSRYFLGAVMAAVLCLSAFLYVNNEKEKTNGILQGK